MSSTWIIEAVDVSAKGPFGSGAGLEDRSPDQLIKRMMAGGRFLTRNLKATKTEMALSILAYNILRAINIRAAIA